jgi:hypothetical protein
MSALALFKLLSVETVNFVEIEAVNSIADNGAIEFNCLADVNEFIY